MDERIRINLCVDPEDGLIYDVLSAVSGSRRAERVKRMFLLGVVAERGVVAPATATLTVPSEEAPAKERPRARPRRSTAKAPRQPAPAAPAAPALPSPGPAPSAGGLSDLDDILGDDIVGSALSFQGVGS